MSKRDDVIRALVAPDKISEEKLEQVLSVIKGVEPNKMEGFLDDRTARQFCGNVSRSTLWQWRKKNGLKFYSVGGRRFYKSEDLEKFIESRAFEAN